MVPEETSVAVVTFPTIRDAAAAAAEVMQTGVPVAAMEIMDEVQMRVVNVGGATAPRVWEEAPTLFFKFAGTRAGVRENVARVQGITRGHRGGGFEFAKDEREQKLLWSARKESLWSMLALRKHGEEVCMFLSSFLLLLVPSFSLVCRLAWLVLFIGSQNKGNWRMEDKKATLLLSNPLITLPLPSLSSYTNTRNQGART